MPTLKVVILGTGGTIAGTSAGAGDNVGYLAAQIGVDRLAAGLPVPAGVELETEQVAQLDSKDMEFEVWRVLAQRVGFHVRRADVAGVVITHGTDTLEETAYFLQRVLAPAKPVVLTAAMRPATALSADGPQNLADAVTLAATSGASGVLVSLCGAVHAAVGVRKMHPYRTDAFGSGDVGALAHVEDGQLRLHRPWPTGEPLGLTGLPADPQRWPWVEIVTSHAGAGARLVQALVARGVQGIVVAGSGNGKVHHALEAALLQAQAAGVQVLRSTRCLDGCVLPRPDDVLLDAGALTPVQARIELMLRLMPGA